jgi:hypothetical protein
LDIINAGGVMRQQNRFPRCVFDHFWYNWGVFFSWT